MAACKTSYWRDVQIDFGDGKQVTVNVDSPTYEKIVNGDPETLGTIKANLLAANVPDTGLNNNTNKGDNIQIHEEGASGSGAANKKKGEMPEGAVRLLIKLHKKYSNKMIDKKTSKKNVWSLIANEMQKNNIKYTYTWLQIKLKWNNILTPYKNCVKHNQKTGVEPKYCKYYDDLDEYIGCRPFVRPRLVLSNSTIQQSSDPLTSTSEPLTSTNGHSIETQADDFTDNDQSEILSDDDDIRGNPLPTPPVETKRKRLSKRNSEIFQILENHELKRQEDTEKILEVMNKEHQEVMEIERRRLELEQSKIDIFQKLIEKF